MKTYLKIHLKFALFILFTFTITSFILAGIISFIHLSNSLYHFIVNLLAAIIMIIWAILIVKKFKNNALGHSIICGLLFLGIAILINLNNLNIINIISRPLILIITTAILSYYQKNS